MLLCSKLLCVAMDNCLFNINYAINVCKGVRGKLNALSNISTSSRSTDGSCAAALIVESDQRDTHHWGEAGMLPSFQRGFNSNLR